MQAHANSIDFLLENAGPVIQYRLRKEILHDLTADDEARLLEQIYQLPHYKLVESYVKPNGNIGSGAHSWDKWQGLVLHETPLQDGECAARMLSYYAVPKSLPIVANFVAAMRDEDTLREEFSYIPPELVRFEQRFDGMRSGSSLMITLYAMQAMLGYGDDVEVDEFREISYEAFRSMLDIDALSDIAKMRRSKSRYNYPYIEADDYFPCAYHLTTLAYTSKWRTPERVQTLADALNHIGKILPDNTEIAVKIGGKYVIPGWAFRGPRLKPFRADTDVWVMYRRVLTEIAMLGVGERVDIIRESAFNLWVELGEDGILRGTKSMKRINYPMAYSDVGLEPDYKRKYALECDLTFWALQFLSLINNL